MSTPVYLLTRFNIGVYSHGIVARDHQYNDSDKKVPVNPELWMKERVGLLRDFLIPNIQNQTSDDFLWIIALDVRTPTKWRDKIKNLLSGINVKITYASSRFVNYYDKRVDPYQFKSSIAEDMMARGLTDDMDIGIVTFRVDADAMLAKNTVARLATRSFTETTLLVPLQHHILHIVAGKVIGGRVYGDDIIPAIIGLYERVDNFGCLTTIEQHEHTRSANFYDVEVLTDILTVESVTTTNVYRTGEKDYVFVNSPIYTTYYAKAILKLLGFEDPDELVNMNFARDMEVYEAVGCSTY